MICSDGLYDMLEDWEIEQCMSQDKGVKESAKALVNKTLKKMPQTMLLFCGLIWKNKRG